MAESQKLRATDVVVLVMGNTGSGRSTFINKLVPGNVHPMEVSSSQRSCTRTVQHTVLDKASVNLGSATHKSGRLVLVDTPGFNREKQPDSGVLQDIANWSQNRLPDGGCRVGVVILHDVTAHLSQRLADMDIAILRKSFNMVVATSKWDPKYQAETDSDKVHNALIRHWEKPSGRANFHKLKEDSDAQAVLEDLLSQVDNEDSRKDVNSIFTSMAADRQKREAKQDSGLRKFFRSLAFWRK